MMTMEIPSVFIGLLKTSLVFSILFGFYLVFLHKERRFKLNRIILISIIIVSISIPFLSFKHKVVNRVIVPMEESITREVEISPQALPLHISNELPILQEQAQQVEGKANASISPWNIIFYLYLIVVAFMIFRFMLYIVSFYVKLAKTQKTKQLCGRRVKISDTWSQTFSFFGTIVMTERDLMNSNRDILIKHELVHAKQVHSLDLLLAELFLALNWFNPLAYRLKKTMCEVHEYIADGSILNEGTDSNHYKQLIVNCVSNALTPNLTSSFSAKLLKNRFEMISNKSRKNSIARYTLVVPIALALFMLLSFRIDAEIEYVIEEQSVKNNIYTETGPHNKMGHSQNAPKEAIDPEEKETDQIEQAKTAQPTISEKNGEKTDDRVFNDDKKAESQTLSDSTVLVNKLNALIGNEYSPFYTLLSQKDIHANHLDLLFGEGTSIRVFAISTSSSKPNLILTSKKGDRRVFSSQTKTGVGYNQYDFVLPDRGAYTFSVENQSDLKSYLISILLPNNLVETTEFGIGLPNRDVWFKEKGDGEAPNLKIFENKISYASNKVTTLDKLSSLIPEHEETKTNEQQEQPKVGERSMLMRKGELGSIDGFEVRFDFF